MSTCLRPYIIALTDVIVSRYRRSGCRRTTRIERQHPVKRRQTADDFDSRGSDPLNANVSEEYELDVDGKCMILGMIRGRLCLLSGTVSHVLNYITHPFVKGALINVRSDRESENDVTFASVVLSVLFSLLTLFGDFADAGDVDGTAGH